MRRTIGILSAIVAVLAFSAGSATASSHPRAGLPPRVLNSADKICANSENSLCWTGNGSGQQMTVTTAGQANITFIPVNGEPTGTYEMQDGSGNCVRVDNSDAVNITGGSCSQSDTHEWFSEGEPFSGVFTFFSAVGGADASITGLNNNNKIWIGNNTYFRWVLCNQSCS